MKQQTIMGVLWGSCMLLSQLAAAQEFDPELHLSNNEDVYWYRICSALPGLEAYAVTDYSEEDEFIPVQMLPTEEADFKSQWKLIAGNDGKVILRNRASGQELDGVSLEMDNCNATLIMPAGTSAGFQVTSLGEYVFKLESEEDDGINRCLAVADMYALPVSYPQENLATSHIGWKFLPVEVESATGIGTQGDSRTIIRIANRRISVKGGTKWQLFNAQGEEMPRTTRLSTGVYMVKTGEKTVKVYIP